MLFNTYQFFVFLSVVVLVFFLLPHRFRWIFMLGASYFYYMYWDLKYGILIMTTTVVVYATALLMEGRSQGVKKLLVALSVIINLSILASVKYFNFVNDSLKDLFTLFGASYTVPSFNILMGIGISFYTFQALSYTIDIYRGTRKPERHFGIFALYVSFFPVLLCGPIERSTTLLPQLYKEMEYDYDRVTDGLKLMAWGYFQKLVIADRLGEYISQVQANPEAFSGLPILVAIYLYPFQVLCDFSGYTDMAIGAAQILGYKLTPNFRRPFLALSLNDMWRRWHISLISWFRDYLYIPLGGNRVARWRQYLNLMIIFALSGLWHGAQWTFVLWGSLNGLFIIISRMTQRLRDWTRENIFRGIGGMPAAAHFALAVALVAAAFFLGKAGIRMGTGGKIAVGACGAAAFAFGIVRIKSEELYGRWTGGLKKFWMMLVVFHLFAYSGIFFGVRTVKDGVYMITHCFARTINTEPLTYDPFKTWMMFILVAIYMAIQYVQEYRGSIRDLIRPRPAWMRWLLYALLCSSILLIGVRGAKQFIYFKF
ncbi:MAG: MBOAT family protein [Spirochaetes bacterium]|nr:MBOAT family protein [Spirochaetota bacterium]